MNNNRNNRRRGRGNRNNQSGGGNQLNRIDSRARGNAPQLLDKYKKLAQDAQHNGDRVQAEYYLQFADHYFRVIADNKARQDEARAKRNEGREPSGEEGEDAEDSEGRRNDNRRDGRNDGPRSNNRRTRGRRDDQDGEGSSDKYDNGAPEEGEIGAEGESVSSEDVAPKPKRRARKPKAESEDGDAPRKPRARRTRSKSDDGDAGGLDSSVLPPAIGSEDSDGDDNVEAAA